MSSYPSCNYINTGITFFPNNVIKMCCFTDSHEVDIASTTDSVDAIVEQIARKKREMRESFKRGDIYDCCKGCPNLIERQWSEADIISQITLNHFMFCNLKCDHCGYVEGVKNGSLRDTDHGAVLDIIKNLSARAMLSDDVLFDVGGGEPSLSDGLKDIVGHVIGEGRRVHINSNAAKYVDLFAKGVNEGLIHLTLTPDAGSREVYKAIKGKDNFANTWKTIERYVAECNGNVLIKFVLQKGNVQDIENMLKKSKESGVRHVALSLDLRDWDKAGDDYIGYARSFREEAEKYSISVVPRMIPGWLWEKSTPVNTTNHQVNDPMPNNGTMIARLLEKIDEAGQRQAQGDLQGAILIYRQWLQHSNSPDDWPAYFNLGILLKDAGELVEARQSFAAALERKPDLSQAKTAIALVDQLLAEASTDAGPTAAPHQRLCNYCQKEVDRFLPYRGGRGSLSHLSELLDHIGSDVDNFGCPHCASTDRERHLKLYCTALNVLKKDARILHFAPEWNFVSHAARFDPQVHVFADLYANDPRFEKINIEKIPYSDGSFDYVIANHVMEHVADPDAALMEINRVLKTDGVAILQTPYSGMLHKTLEDPGINTDELRLEFYGQEDHVRLFGLDIFERFSAHLDPAVASHQSLFDSSVSATFGVNPREPFFLFRKKAGSVDPAPSGRRPARRTRSKKPLVSVVCVTYNHERLIRDALESFMHQETDFDYEVLVGEDCSTDATRQAIESFSFDNPRCALKPVFHKTNLGASRNFTELLAQAQGKYIAICEGDDYWTDSGKLQKQVDYLESAPDVSLVYSNVNSHRVGEGFRLDYMYVGGRKTDLTGDELKHAPPINTLTAMFRNVLQTIPAELHTSGAGDMFLWSLLGWHGGGHYLASVLPSIHRQHAGGIHSYESQKGKWLMNLMTSYSLLLYYRRIGESGLTDYYTQRCLLIAQEVASGGEETMLERLLGLPSRMSEMAKGEYAFDGELLAHIVRMAIADPKAMSAK